MLPTIFRQVLIPRFAIKSSRTAAGCPYKCISSPGDPRGENSRIPDEVRAGVFEIANVGEVLGRAVKAGGKVYIVRLGQKTDAHERAYAEVVVASGHSDQLRQLFVHRAGHCSFTAAEQIAAFQALVRRLDTGRWEDSALSPTAMNASAMSAGTRYNELGSQFRPTPPAFFAYQPPAFMRPFDARSTLP